MPRTLYVMSYSALLVKDDIQKYCRLLIHMKSIKPFHYADLEPWQLGAAITNQICFSLMKRGWMAFALEDQTEGVMLQYDVSSPSLSFQNTKAFAVRNVVVTHEGKDVLQ